MAKILIAEDERDIRDLITFTLSFGGYTVVSASNGEEAVTLAKQELPDLILLDVRMPRMTGYEACAAIKADHRLKDIPVIFLSAKGQESEIEAGLQAGATEYLLKPFAPDQLTARIKTVLSRPAKAPEMPPSGETNVTEKPAAAQPGANIPRPGSGLTKETEKPATPPAANISRPGSSKVEPTAPETRSWFDRLVGSGAKAPDKPTIPAAREPGRTSEEDAQAPERSMPQETRDAGNPPKAGAKPSEEPGLDDAQRLNQSFPGEDQQPGELYTDDQDDPDQPTAGDREDPDKPLTDDGYERYSP